MRSALKLLMFTIFCLSLTNCALFGGGDESEEANTEDYPKYDNYSSSDIYQDIDGESREPSSEEYADDDYGDAGSDSDEEEDDSQDEQVYLSSADSEEDNNVMAAVEEDPLPVERVAKPMKKARKKKSKKKFKNGMYRMGIDCNMRKKASAKSKKMGKVKKGKKLWVEGHNANWVKVYKKSGPVFINRGCL